MKIHRILVPLALSLVAAGITGQAQTAPRITQRVDVRQRVQVASAVPAAVARATDLGRADSSLPIRDLLVAIQLNSEQQHALDSFLEDAHDASSAQYHQWLSPEQFGAKFGIADSDLAAVEAWLNESGLQISEVAKSRAWIRVSGTAAQVESAFGTELHQYTLNGKTEYSASKPISVPVALSPVVAGVVSLSSFRSSPQHTDVRHVARSADGKLHAGETHGPRPAFTSPTSPEATYLAPGDFSRIYNTTPLLNSGINGKGLSIGILGRSDVYLSDIEAFRTLFSLPYNDPRIIYPNGDPGILDGDDEESTLDLEWAGAVAPKASIQFISGNSTYSTDGIDIAAAYAVDHRSAPILSLSYGSCEQGTPTSEIQFFNRTWEQAAAEGITVLVAAGDSGSSSCTNPSEYADARFGLGVNALAATAYNTAVGGTEFLDTNLDTYWNLKVRRDQSSAIEYIPEATWNESCDINLPVSLGNCYFQDQSFSGAYAGGGGADNCAVHDDSASIFTGLYTCSSGRPKPSWQIAKGVPNDKVRDLPDLALAAAGGHDGYLICFQGSCQWDKDSKGNLTLTSASVIGGTSASTPSMAGIMALVEQRIGAYQGQANYHLYPLSAAETNSAACNSSHETNPGATSACIFHDVTAGTNALTCTASNPDCTGISTGSNYGVLSGFKAKTGFDLSTGLGSIDAANLVKAWAGLASIGTTTTLTVNPNHFVHGTSIELTTTVAADKGVGTPTGEVVYLVTDASGKNVPVATQQLTNGIFAGDFAALPGGTYTLTARYGGDGTYKASVSPMVELHVSAEASKVVAETLAPSRFFVLGRRPIVPASATGLGNNFFIKLSISGASGKGAPTGSVALTNGRANLGTYMLGNDGVVSIPCGPGTSCDLPLGKYIFTAKYSGDPSFNPISTQVPFAIEQGSLILNQTVNNATPSPDTKITAITTFEYDPAVIPTGTIKLTRDDTSATIATGTIGKDGTCVISFVPPLGTYGVIPVYSGDANYKEEYVFSYPDIAVAKNTLPTTTLSMVVKPTTTTVGDTTNISIVVNPTKKSTLVPTGSVYLTLTDGSITTNFPLVGGATTLNLPWPSAGTYSFSATYSGDTHFAPSTGKSVSVTVQKGQPTLRIVPNSSTVQAPDHTSFTAYLQIDTSLANVDGPTGTVQFYDSVDGKPTRAIGAAANVTAGNGTQTILATTAVTLPVGKNVITAVYGGDANWKQAEAGRVVVTAKQ